PESASESTEAAETRPKKDPYAERRRHSRSMRRLAPLGGRLPGLLRRRWRAIAALPDSIHDSSGISGKKQLSSHIRPVGLTYRPIVRRRSPSILLHCTPCAH